MQVIDLYPSLPSVAVQMVDPRDRTSQCELCSLHKRSSGMAVCLPARMKAPARDALGPKLEPEPLVYVVGEYPSQTSASVGRAFEGASERWVRGHLRRRWSGHVLYDYAIKCSPKGATLNATHHRHCRPYTAAVMREVRPDRIITLGNHAAKGLLGYRRGGSSHCNRRGYTYIYDQMGAIPVFLLSRPSDPSQNRFFRRLFLEDLDWALTAVPGDDIELAPLGAKTFALDPTAADAEFMLDYVRDSSWLAIDVETYGEHFAGDFRLLSMGIAAENQDDVISMDSSAIYDEGVFGETLRHILTSPAWVKRGHNFKFDFQSVRLALGLSMHPVFGDTRLQFKLLNPDGDAALDQLGELVGMGGHKDEAEGIVRGEVKRLRAEYRRHNPGGNVRHFRAHAYAYAALPRDINLRYVSRDSLTTARLFRALEPELKAEAGGVLWRTYTRTVDPASKALANIESNGVRVSRDHVGALGAHLQLELGDIEDRLFALDAELNPASSMSVGKFVYERLGLPVVDTTATGKPSTAKGTLERMQGAHSAIPLILDWRRLTKLYTTYVQGLLPFIRDDGRIHPSLLLDGTGTGRLSCKQPNLQNIPSRGGAEARMVKDCFMAAPGRVLLQVDYATLEIRIAALLSGDPQMIAVLQSGVDFHLGTAQLIGPAVWGMSAEEIRAEYDGGDKTKRSIAKTINFGTLYGQSSFALAAQISAHTGRPFPAFGVLRGWIDKQRSRVATVGDAWTVWDGELARRRPLYAAGFGDSKRSGTAMRSSFNTPIQGSGSDYCLMSLIEVERVCREYWDRDCFPVLTVHDSILLDMRLDVGLLCDVIGVVHEIMTGWPSGDVPLVVDFELGESWGSMMSLNVDQFGELRDFSVPDQLIRGGSDGV